MTTARQSASESKRLALQATRDFRAIRDREFVALSNERKTQREAIEILARAFDKILTAYLRAPATSYAGWLEHGPRDTWDEVLSAAADDAVWDRLVERIARDHEHRTHKRRGMEAPE